MTHSNVVVAASAISFASIPAVVYRRALSVEFTFAKTYFMQVPKKDRLLPVILCAAAVSVLVSPGLCAERNPAARTASETNQRRPWLLVSLSVYGVSPGARRVYRVITNLSGNPNARLLHYSEVTPELVAEIQPEFVVLGPQGTPWCRYGGKKGVELQNFMWLVRLVAEQFNIPILGICGGHQALAMAFGGKVGPIRGGSEDCLPYVRHRQSGISRLTLETRDPIFQGIGKELRVAQSHYDEVKELPPTFVLLASDPLSPHQIIRHAQKPIYGIQGHPESFRPHYPEGGLLLKNFLQIARAHNHEAKPRATSKAGPALAARPYMDRYLDFKSLFVRRLGLKKALEGGS